MPFARWWIWAVAMAAAAAVPGRAGTNDWVTRAEVRHPCGNLTLTSPWDPSAGLHLRVTSLPGGSDAVIDIRKSGGRFSVLGGAAGAVTPTAEARYWLDALPAQRSTNASFVLKFRPESWSLYCAGKLIALLPVPFAPPALVAQQRGDFPPADAMRTSFQRVEEIVFHDDFMVPTNEPDSLTSWTVESGTWRLHTALDDALVDPRGARLDTKPLKPDFSPNFYSLNGTASNGPAVITTGYRFYDAYSAAAALQVQPGEMGLVFLYVDATNYYALTTQFEDESGPARIVLWRVGPSARGTVRHALAAGTAPLIPGQWVSLRVALSQDRIRCFVDSSEVADVSEALPVGGRFGLFVRGAEDALFDDVTIESNHEIDLRSRAAIRFYSREQSGDLLGAPRRWFRAEPSASELAPAVSPQAQWLALGAPGHPGHVFSATFTAQSGGGSFGLLAGYAGPSSPHLRFVCARSRGREEFRLERVSGGRAVVIERLERPSRGGSGRPDVLMADASGGSEIRLYRNGEMVLVHAAGAPIDGASGLYVGPDTDVRIAGLSYAMARSDVYKSRTEKNLNYTVDPFMRHWSSPEGEWIEDEAHLYWHKSDFFGRIDLSFPLRPGSLVHVGVPEGRANGEYVVHVGASNIWVFAGDRWPEPPRVRSPVPPGEPTNAVSAAELAPMGDRKGKGRGKGLAKNLRRAGAESRRTAYQTGLDPDAYDALAARLPRQPPRPDAALLSASFTCTAGAPVTLSYEGDWLWLTESTNRVFQLALQQPLRGTRMRVAGALTNELPRCAAVRYGVKDYLFTEAPTDWTINGGRWEVINRFNCDPRWSHMNGEGTNGLAAIWTKYRFSGDFCMEMYAGMRMGWYERCGDLNISIMCDRTSPSSGYTATCTGWDYDLSQQLSRLYRRGEVLAESDKYLVPRIREGNRRLRSESIISGGRDVHGAWYYIKLRRIGDTLEYYFDNELIYRQIDSEPLNDGLAGVWTFINSMMVARVKIAAQGIRPAGVPFTPTPLPRDELQAQPPARRPDPPAAAAPAPVAPAERMILATMSAAWWSLGDSVGHSQLAWAPSEVGPALTLRNRLGSGRQFVACRLPPVRYAELAGWRFYVRRSPGSQFNFYYSIGRVNNGEFVPERRYFHRISGPAVAGDGFRAGGATDVPGAKSGVSPDEAPWTLVQAWVPTEGQDAGWQDRNLLVRIDGFGILQPSYEQEGLTGNGPGEWYAVAGLHEVRYGSAAPELGAWRSGRAQFADARSGAERSGWMPATNAVRWLDANTATGFNHVAMTVADGAKTNRGLLAWIRLPAEADVRCEWSTVLPNAVVLRSGAAYPEPRFEHATLSLNGVSVPLAPAGKGARSAFVPRLPETTPSPSNAALTAVVRLGSTNRTFRLAWAGANDREPPALVRLDGLAGLFENFEARGLGPSLEPSPERMTVRSLDPMQGSYLQMQNREIGERLRMRFRVNTSLARYPVLAFRYRLTPMANISIGLQDSQSIVRFAEVCPAARAVEYAGPGVVDDTWHTWIGRVSDAVVQSSLNRRLFQIPSLTLGSFASPDQTGRYSWWDVDDVVLGPAVSGGAQLAFTPGYFAHGGVKSVRMALVHLRGPTTGAQPLPLPDGEPDPTWQTITNGARTTPDVTRLEDGLCMLLLQAVGESGLESPVTRVPFILDRKPLTVTHELERSIDPLSNGSMLRLAFRGDDGVPLDMEGLQFRWNDRPASMSDYLSQFARYPGLETVWLNWPYMFRDQLNRATNGLAAAIIVSGIVDGAGNRTPDISVPVSVDYAKDKRGPTLLPPRFPTGAVFFATSWQGVASKPTFFQAEQGHTVSVQYKPGDEPFLVTENTGKRPGGINMKLGDRKWRARAYPTLMFMMRRPALTNADPARIEVALEVESIGTYYVPLSGKPDKHKDRLPLAAPIAWSSNVWQTVVLDVPALLAQRLTPAQVDKALITSFGIQRREPVERTPLHLKSVFVCRPWPVGQKVVLDAYDVSGVAGAAWCGTNLIDGLTVEPAALPHGCGEAGWLPLQVRDRAGNLSESVRIPVP